jgi:hypothetical protein
MEQQSTNELSTLEDEFVNMLLPLQLLFCFSTAASAIGTPVLEDFLTSNFQDYNLDLSDEEIAKAFNIFANSEYITKSTQNGKTHYCLKEQYYSFFSKKHKTMEDWADSIC